MTGWFDIDYGGGVGDVTDIDSDLRVFTGGGSSLAASNNSQTGDGAAGSVSTDDSYIGYTFAGAGTYYVRVSAYFATPIDGETILSKCPFRIMPLAPSLNP